jgi:exonuclease III
MRDKFNITDLPIVSWNVHGIFSRHSGFRYNKLHSPFFKDAIGDAKLFGLVETHHVASEIDQIQLDGFKCYNVCRKKKRLGRNSGGIAVYVHETLLKGVQKIPSSGSENLLIKLSQSFFGLSRDVVVCFSYCVPENSSFQVREQLDVYGDLELKLSSVGQNIDKLCFGDYNARTGLKLDYLESEDNTDIPIPMDIYETDIMRDLPRQNMDIGTNKYGENLLSLCKSVPLRICNGRKLGDIFGSYTCYAPNGQSCVDYCLVSPRLFDRVQTFSVGQVSTLSDHCPVRAVLMVKVLTERFQDDYNFIESPSKIKWDKDISYRFENILQSPEYVLKAENLCLTHGVASQEDIDQATQNITNFLVEGTLKANCLGNNDVGKINKTKQKPKRKRKRNFFHPKWHDLSCEEAHRKVSVTARLLKGDQKNLSLGSKLRKEIKDYNKLVKLKNKQFVDNMFVELDSMERNDPRGYMELIRSMRNGGFDKATSDDTSGITPPTWHTHFSDLLAKTVDPIKKDNFEELIKDNIDSIDNELNEPFTLSELSAGLKDLKNNKASSFDKVSNEMLKTSG